MSLLDIFIKKAHANVDPDIFGSIEAPQGVKEYNIEAGGVGNIGIIVFAANAIRVFSVVAGVFVLFNFVTAGLALVSGGGKSDKYSEATNKITMSVIGLLLIVASYTIAGIIGLLIFGEWNYILNPQICGPDGC